MTQGEALQTIRDLAGKSHIRSRRGLPWQPGSRPSSFDDIRNALVYAVSCAARPEGRWAATGVDLDSEVLSLLLYIDGDMLWVEAIE